MDCPTCNAFLEMFQEICSNCGKDVKSFTTGRVMGWMEYSQHVKDVTENIRKIDEKAGKRAVFEY